jgi:hypothetical protein
MQLLMSWAIHFKVTSKVANGAAKCTFVIIAVSKRAKGYFFSLAIRVVIAHLVFQFLSTFEKCFFVIGVGVFTLFSIFADKMIRTLRAVLDKVFLFLRSLNLQK